MDQYWSFSSATFVTLASLNSTPVSGSVSWSAEFPASLSPMLKNFLLQGDYNKYECGLTVEIARAEDNGDWECEFESYVKVGEDFLEYFESYVKVGILCWNEPIYIYFWYLASLLFAQGGSRGYGFKAAEKFRVVVETPSITTSTAITASTTTTTIIEERLSTTDALKPGDLTCIGEKCKG